MSKSQRVNFSVDVTFSLQGGVADLNYHYVDLEQMVLEALEELRTQGKLNLEGVTIADLITTQVECIEDEKP